MMNLLIEPSGVLTESLTQTLIAFSPQEAYAGITLLAIASDTYLADEELEAIDRHLRRMHLFQHYQPETMRRMYQKLFTILQRDGEDLLLASARETLPPELREAAFASASDLIFDDSTREIIPSANMRSEAEAKAASRSSGGRVSRADARSTSSPSRCKIVKSF